MRFVADIMSAVRIIITTKDRTAKEAKPAAAAEQQQGGGGSSGPALAASPAASKPGGEPGGRMEVVVQLQNVGLVVPTSTKSRSALGGQVDHLMIAVPGGLWQWGQWAQWAKKGCACGLVVAGSRWQVQGQRSPVWASQQWEPALRHTQPRRQAFDHAVCSCLLHSCPLTPPNLHRAIHIQHSVLSARWRPLMHACCFACCSPALQALCCPPPSWTTATCPAWMT